MRIAVHDYAGHPFQFELSRSLAARGHVVRHFYFADDPGPKGQADRRPGDPDGYAAEALRIPIRYDKQSLSRRFAGDVAYGIVARNRIRAFRPDVVISGNTPLDSQAIIEQGAAADGARFVYWLQDFYSIAIGCVLSRRFPHLGRIVTRYYAGKEAGILRRSAAIVLISPDFRPHLPADLGERPSVRVIRNWGALGSISRPGKQNDWAVRYGIADKFVFMYTGTLGVKHGIEPLLLLAKAYEADATVAVVVAAAGCNADLLRRRLAAEPLPNLMLLPLQPIEVFSEVLASADVLLTLLESDGGEFAVPSKMLNYLCAGRPILLSAPARNLCVRVLEESGAGIAVNPFDDPGFLQAAERLRRDAGLRGRLGESARAYAERHFDIAAITTEFEAAFAAALAAPREAARTGPWWNVPGAGIRPVLNTGGRSALTAGGRNQAGGQP